MHEHSKVVYLLVKVRTNCNSAFISSYASECELQWVASKRTERSIVRENPVSRKGGLSASRSSRQFSFPAEGHERIKKASELPLSSTGPSFVSAARSFTPRQPKRQVHQPSEGHYFASRALSPVSERDWGHIPAKKMSEIRFCIACILFIRQWTSTFRL